MNSKSASIAKADIQRMLSAVFTLCLMDEGLSKAELDATIQRSLAEATKRVRVLKPHRARSMNLELLGSILHRWNRNPKYLDLEAHPFPIPASGPAPSVEALFRAENKLREFKLGLRQMQRARLITRTKEKRFLPRNDSILLHTLTPEMVANLSLSIHRLVSTLLQNTSPRRQGASRLIERNALVPDLPKRKLEEFKSFSREQGAAFVSTMNDWLETRRVLTRSKGAARRKATVSAGIHVFAFSDAS